MSNNHECKRRSELNDPELLDVVRNGNKDAFKEFIKRYEKMVSRTVIGMLGNCPESEDVGQEVFIRFYKSLDKFRGESSIGTYITRIAINLSLNEIKRRKRQEIFSIFKSDTQEYDDMLKNLPDHGVSRDEVEAKEIVQIGIQKLEPKFRAVIVLRLIDGYSTEETAKILGLPIGTVLSRLARAQMKLKEILNPILGGHTCP